MHIIGQRMSAEDVPADRSPRCGSCAQSFTWEEAHLDLGTPSPTPGRAPSRPRTFCPGCGALVAEWHLDLVNDLETWTWVGENATVNGPGQLPPSPMRRWGRPTATVPGS